jgi:hypothetical protein
MWTVEGKEFDAYYKAFDYAMFLKNTEERSVEIKKSGAKKGVVLGDETEVAEGNNYFNDL